MVDTRFHRFAGSSTIGTILTALDRGDLLAGLGNADLSIEGVTELELAGPGEIALAAHTDYVEELRATAAGVVVVLPALRDLVPAHSLAIAIDKPHQLFADILDHLYPSNTRSIIAAGREDLGAPVFERDVSIGSNVVVGPGVEIGRGTVIGANTVIGAGVTIGRNCIIAANCTIDCAHLGNEVVIHSGVRIGTEGFGWLDFGQSNRKVPQLGRVLIQDRVEIGARAEVAGNAYAVRDSRIRSAWPCAAGIDDQVANEPVEIPAEPAECFDHMAYSVASAGAVVGVRLFSSVWLNAFVGHSFYRRFEQMNEFDERITGGVQDLPNTLLIRAGLTFRIPRE